MPGGDVGSRGADGYGPPSARPRGDLLDLSCERPGVRRRFDSTPNGGAQRTTPGVTAPCAMPRCVPLASTRCGPHVTAGWMVVSAGAMPGSLIPHSSASTTWRLVQAGAASRRLDAPSTAQWRSPAWLIAHHACLRERDESPRVRIRPPVSMTICRHACRHVLAAEFPSQANISSER
jgi:hypothetical protein